MRLPRSLTHDLAFGVTVATAQAVQAPGAGPIAVDASALEQFDSSALAVLLDCRRRALAAGRSFTVTGVPQRLLQLAILYGVAGLISGAPMSATRTP